MFDLISHISHYDEETEKFLILPDASPELQHNVHSQTLSMNVGYLAGYTLW
jgi:hypothetical protein